MNLKSQKPQLPTSLKRKRILNIVIRSTICLLLLVIFITVIIVWGNRLFPDTLDHRAGYTSLKIMFYMIVLCVPFLITGIPFKLIDTSWSGTITAVKIRESLGTTSNPRYVYVYPKEDLILTIRRDDGKEIKQTVLSLAEKFEPGQDGTPNGKVFYHTHKYNLGDRVYKYYGFKHLYLIPTDYQNSKICICCGSQNKIEAKSCWYCNSELMK